MSVELSNLSLTLTQTQEQRLLRVVDVAYNYTLKNIAVPGTKDPGTPFQVDIDILGDDVFVDDLLVKSVDGHDTVCAPDATQSVERSLIVAQALLDEDIGDDEIVVLVRVSRSSGRGNDPKALTQAKTPIVKGKF